MKNCKRIEILLFFVLVSGLFGSAAFALESDSEQPITIDSNSATYDDRKEVSTYTGNVIAIQGSMKLNSDKLVVFLKNGEVQKLVATGKPARFKQKPSEKEDEIRGKSMKAEYYPDRALLVLIDDAVVWQDRNTYASDIIKYDSKNALVKAGEQSSETKRVRVTLKPKAKKSQEDEQASSETANQELQ